MIPARTTAFHELLHMSPDEKQALGIVATAGEIAQQPETWKSTHSIFRRHSADLRSFLERTGLRGSVPQRPTVILTGAGTSDYIGQALALLLRTQWQTETFAVPSTDLLTNLSDYILADRRYVIISSSRSGDSPEGVAVLDQVLSTHPAIAHIVITCNAHGRMAHIAKENALAYCIVLDDSVNDRGLAMTSSFTNMVLAGQLLAHLWDESGYDAIFRMIHSAGAAFLPIAAEEARQLANSLFKRVCLLGSGALKAVARESALKILEMSAGRVPTMSESVLGLRHGPMSALDAETLLVCYVSSDEKRQRYEADLLRELGSKGVVAQRVVVGPASNPIFENCSERYLALEYEVPDLYRPVLDIFFGQLLGFYLSLSLNLKPDAPSPRGIISRVVEKFTIYT